MTILRRILVPYDFSEAATHALRVAAGLAKEHGGRLMVLHVVTPYQPVTQLPEVGGWLTDRELVAGTKRTLDGVVRRELRDRGTPPARFQVDLGYPVTRIIGHHTAAGTSEGPENTSSPSPCRPLTSSPRDQLPFRGQS